MKSNFKKIDEKYPENHEYNNFDLFMSKECKSQKNSKLNGFEIIGNNKVKIENKDEIIFKKLDTVIYRFPKGTIVDLYGPTSSGKSQILFQSVVNISRKDKKILFIDSSGDFRPERIIQLSQIKKYNIKEILNNIFTIRCNSLDQQLETIPKIKEFIKNNNVTYVIIDDLTRNFTEYPFESRNEIEDILSEYIRELAYIAWNNNISLIVTNSVRANIDDSQINEKETYETVINRLIHLRVSLKRINEFWLARNNKEKQCIFNITKNGIEGVK